LLELRLMLQAAFSCSAPLSPFHSLPFEVEHKASRATPVILLLLLVPALATVIVPLALVLAFAAQDLWQAVAQRPFAATILGAGLIAWLGLLLAAAKRLLVHFGNRRRVRIDTDRVTVAEKALLSSRQWSTPLREFSGIAHHMRATLSGVRHELILVHPTRERSVLLLASHAIGQATIDHAARLLRLPQIPAHPLDRNTQRHVESSVLEALPQTA
jgi:hypothetical protein